MLRTAAFYYETRPYRASTARSAERILHRANNVHVPYRATKPGLMVADRLLMMMLNISLQLQLKSDSSSRKCSHVIGYSCHVLGYRYSGIWNLDWAASVWVPLVHFTPGFSLLQCQRL